MLDIFLEYSIDSNISVCCGALKALSQSPSGPGRFFLQILQEIQVSKSMCLCVVSYVS